jgi:DNA replication and repair protein RecF
MRILRVKFQQFRNLGQVELAPGFGANILVGKNAQGKTNMLEGIFAVAAGGSFRVSNERVLIARGQDFARVELEFENQKEDSGRAELVWMTEGGFAKKTTKLDGVVVSRGDLVQRLPVVLFSPEDIDLIRLSPQRRRKFLDLLIARFDLEYQQDLLDYWKVLRQRNQLLLMVKQGRSPESDLEVWDEKMSELGARIVTKRKQVMAEVGRLANEFYRTWFGESGEELKISYVPNLNFETPKMYGAGLAGARSIDIVRANTSKGIHRDDVVFSLGGNDMRTSASRGEFRSAVLSLKLAEGEILKSKMSDLPVYLLDDIFSELDEDRQQRLAQALSGVQVFVTTNDERVEELFEESKVWQVEQGMVVGAAQESLT